MLNPNQIQLLEQYHNGLLSDAERSEVEKYLENPDFKAEAEGYFQLLDGFAALELEAFGEQLQTWEAKHQRANTKKGGIIVFFRKYRIAVAAAIILMIIPLAYFGLQSNSASEQIFADNFTHYKAFSLTTRAVTPAGSEKDAKELTLQVLLNQGINAYNAREYDQAIDFLERYLSITEDAKNTDEVNLYLGISKLVENQLEEAKGIFKSLTKESKNNTIKNTADWYLALTLIKNKEARPAKKQLKKIIQQDSKYKEKAKTILTDFEKYFE